jgi:PAS domain-containing protein
MVAQSRDLKLTWNDDRQELIVVDNRDGRVFRLNRIAGAILESLPVELFEGHPHEEFIRSLVSSGLAAWT